ncbi:MAG: HD domain-containing protein [Eubacteriales bacterium]|nr:HD domain-containing protein [Eubacteriales bacterium]
MKIPDDQTCERLWNEAGTPLHVRKHCEAVMRRACALCEELPSWRFDEDLVAAGALLHDIMRAYPRHAEAGADFLDDKGYPEVARVVRDHMRLRDDMEAHIDERAVVYLADKMVMEDMPCSIAARYLAAALRGADPAAMEKETARAEALYDKMRRNGI